MDLVIRFVSHVTESNDSLSYYKTIEMRQITGQIMDTKSKLNKLSNDEIFEAMRKLVNSNDDAEFAVYDLLCDEYMQRVPEETFVQAMDILDKEMEW